MVRYRDQAVAIAATIIVSTGTLSILTKDVAAANADLFPTEESTPTTSTVATGRAATTVLTGDKLSWRSIFRPTTALCCIDATI